MKIFILSAVLLTVGFQQDVMSQQGAPSAPVGVPIQQPQGPDIENDPQGWGKLENAAKCASLQKSDRCSDNRDCTGSIKTLKCVDDQGMGKKGYCLTKKQQIEYEKLKCK